MDIAKAWLNKIKSKGKEKSSKKKKTTTRINVKEGSKTAEEAVSNAKKQKAAAAKQFIENHYKLSLFFLMLSSKDINFVGYTYKNVEIVNEDQLSGIAELKKKSTKPKRPSIKSLFEDETAGGTTSYQGSFLKHLPPQI
ncbi:hypothetical protein F2Q70_00036641 [Brassica cretica]|uniref:Uncharacterized protein n=1 Tax=Brassica cretica TaxID=69181 RepID=A0A3N6QZ96_BRACR|nr:hypothetical protein F2Q70_00036641 [Brassica cretica]KAF3533010.1 hypothetical protein DY000_02041775 [Brassica cretica]